MGTKMSDYCCKFMYQQLNYTCKQHGNGDKCPHVIIGRSKSKGNKGKIHIIGRNGEYACNYCPFCGTKWHIQKSS